MDRFGILQTALIIDLPAGLYFAIIMVRYGGPQNALNIALLEAYT
jgi:hypothetical protein